MPNKEVIWVYQASVWIKKNGTSTVATLTRLVCDGHQELHKGPEIGRTNKHPLFVSCQWRHKISEVIWASAWYSALAEEQETKDYFFLQAISDDPKKMQNPWVEHWSLTFPNQSELRYVDRNMLL